MYISLFSTIAIDLALNSTGVLQIGDAAPGFQALATNNKTINLSDLKGRWVVLYFYPKSFTPGCTAEACALRDSYIDIQKIGVVLKDEEEKINLEETGTVILGVSVDDIETQKKFKSRYNLPFELLDDSNKKVSAAYDVLGITGLTAQRKTFIINPEGKIAYIFDKVKASEHDAEVKKVLAGLQGKIK
ncbi:peroxiredoxin [Candidatus Poribacteria bacterium]|nr:peroxiredoxin [Candidatus Poribacteria bacterium]